MPLPTSDFRNPVCLEMKTLKSGYWAQSGGRFLPMSIDLSSANKIGANNNNNNNNNGDLGSVDSSDTYASCNTHPFHSQGDLTSDIADPSCAIVDFVLDSNLYVNPLDNERSRYNSPQQLQQPLALSGLSTSRGSLGVVKKSTSGDTALRSLGASPMEEAFKGFSPVTSDRGSRGSLNDTPVPKHRKTRFQQVSHTGCSCKLYGINVMHVVRKTAAHRRDLYLTTHTTLTVDILAHGEVGTRSRSKQVTVDLRIRPCSHWDRLPEDDVVTSKHVAANHM